MTRGRQKKKLAKQREQAARKAADRRTPQPTPLGRGKSSETVTIIAQAIKSRWHTPDDKKREAMETLAEVFGNRNEEGKVRVAAVKAFISAEAQNQRDEHFQAMLELKKQEDGSNSRPTADLEYMPLGETDVPLLEPPTVAEATPVSEPGGT
jgi:hypothetical protein